jgi:hypothetical protein
MINTFYQSDTLNETKAFLAALFIGIAFGFFLERAGFDQAKNRQVILF